jgi:PAS domain S-box-containing protein
MKDLKGYSGFLIQNKLEELTQENLRLLLFYDIPIMKFFSHLSEEELYQLSRVSVEKFVSALLDGTARADAKQSLKQWEDDEIPGIPKGDIKPSDLVLVYTIQKQGLLKFLPDYTETVDEAINIIKELEDYFVEVQNDAIVMLFKIKQDADLKLRQSEERYRDLFENATDLIHIANIPGAIQYANKAWLTATEYTREELENLTYQKVVHPDYLEIYTKERNRVFAGESPQIIKIAFITKSGKSVFLEGSVSCHFIDCLPENTRSIFQDITARRVSEEKIQKSFIQLAQAQQMAHIGSWEWDIPNNVMSWSEELYRIYEYEQNEPVYPFEQREWIHPDDSEMVLRIMEDVMLNKRSFNFNFRIITKNNNTKSLQAQGTTEVNETGELIKLSGILQDITERKFAEQKIAKTIKQLSQAQEMAHIGSWEWDMKANVISWSDELYRIYGLEPQQFEATFEAYLGYIHPDDRERVNKIISRAAQDKKSFQFDHRILNHKGEERTLSSFGIIMLDKEGNPIMMSGTAQDITERVNVRDELKRAEDTVKAKQQFLSNMSHEIRTPMNAIIGFTKVVLKTELSTKQKEYLDAIKISGETLLVLINDILDLAKVDEGKMTFESIPFKLSSSFAAMIHLFETRMQEKNLNLGKLFDPNIPPVLVGDPVRLHQIILNLMSNAVKFTKRGHVIVAVRLFSEDETSATVEFSITDSGIGIEPERINAVFENFHQATSSTARLYGGTGLGLAIVKQLVEKQGGSIKVKSQVDKGSTFTFYLSFKKPTKEAEMKVVEHDQIESENGASIQNISILVVEDIPLNQLLMKTLLSDFGCEYDLAENGKIAIEKMKEKQFDIVLMDLQMPVMNGFEATEYIRKQLSSKTPIIALTADVTTVDLEKCRAVGMNDYISKPIDERILYNKILKALRRTKSINLNEVDKPVDDLRKKDKVTNLDYMAARTKKNPVLMREMMRLFLEQTPVLINHLKEASIANDWETIQSSAHKLIPSFAIVGIKKEFEKDAQTIQDYSSRKIDIESIREMVNKIETVCLKACMELADEVKQMESHES